MTEHLWAYFKLPATGFSKQADGEDDKSKNGQLDQRTKTDEGQGNKEREREREGEEQW